MRLLRFLPLLLSLLSPLALADRLYEVEIIVFRQSSQPLQASQPAPDDWAARARPLGAGSERPLALSNEAARLSGSNGYQVLLHQAWQQTLGGATSTVAFSSGKASFAHHPVEGILEMKSVRFVDLDAKIWVNQFDADGLLTGSEHLKQSARLKNGELTYLDHGSIGALIRVSPL
jgi:hypothetical protein